MIEKNDHRIASTWKDYKLLLRNKRLNDQTKLLSNRTVLFVHGATYGSTDTFDYEISGKSWMDHLAAQGFDTWCLDLLGYGQSDRPKQMLEPAANNPPIVNTAHAAADVGQAVSFILAQRAIDRVDLIGYSWGTAICGTYTGQHPESVSRLVLSGALWIEGLPPSSKPPAPLGAYRTVTETAMMERWATGLSNAEIDLIVSEAERLKWCTHTASCDPTFADTKLLRAPTGVMQDFADCRETGQNWYDPSLIGAPVLIVVGDLDIETTPGQGQRLFSRLPKTTPKQLTVIGQGTHSLLLENNRHQLHDVVSAFLTN